MCGAVERPIEKAFNRQVGVHLDHVWRQGKSLNVHVVELLRDTWLEKGRRFASCQAPFES